VRVRALDYLIKGSGKLARGVEVRGISATRFYGEQWRDTNGDWRDSLVSVFASGLYIFGRIDSNVLISKTFPWHS
jgi:hypothetical protein